MRSSWFPLAGLLLGCAATAGRTSDATTIERTVRSIDEQERVAVLNRDRSSLEGLWCDDFTVNAPHGQLVVGKSQVLSMLDQGVIHYSSFDRRVESVQVAGDVVVVMGSETVQPIERAPLAGQTVERRFTNIWRGEDGGWCAFARHANAVTGR